MKTIIANWKSNKSLSEVQDWLKDFAQTAPQIPDDVQVVIAPPMPLIAIVGQMIDELQIVKTELGVQDLSSFPAGSYTGATSVKNLETLGAKWAIVGHSERRRYFHETYQDVANKVEQALGAGMTPIVCVDEPDIAKQMAAIDDANWKNCMIAYEPLAAIGSGVEEPIADVKKVVEKIVAKYHPQAVIYGGSVSVANVKGYLEVTDGALVATHSLDVKDFHSVLLATGL